MAIITLYGRRAGAISSRKRYVLAAVTEMSPVLSIKEYHVLMKVAVTA